MIPGPLAALVRGCVRFTRRRVAAPSAPPRLTMQQAAAILAPRPRIVRRAVALGCPAAALPTAGLAPVAPLPVPPIPPGLPLPFDIGTGPLLPPWIPVRPYGPYLFVPTEAADAHAAVPEPGALAILLVAIAMLAAALLWRRA